MASIVPPGAARQGTCSSNACNNKRCAVRAPESVSPTTGKPAPAKCRRIWRLRPVSRRTSKAAADGDRAATAALVTAARPSSGTSILISAGSSGGGGETIAR